MDDLVEYEPTTVDSSQKSEQLLSDIAGGDYWKGIVKDYQQGTINGYQAEMRLSTLYKEHLRKSHTYVLDMPIRLKKEHRPKYRMIHVSGHPDACFLMAQNMLSRKDELFLNVQSAGQMSIYDLLSDIDLTVEGDHITEKDVEEKVKRYIQDWETDNTRYTKFIAEFYTRFGLICKLDMIQGILVQMEKDGKIEILRDPPFTTTGKKSGFWEDSDSKGKKVTIRRLQS